MFGVVKQGGGYLAEIDGLRALAVTLVVLFHLDVAWLRGGYVGVDVFFVISGYLITRLITDEVEAAGRFDFRRFYLRRTRRLLPALLVTIAVSWVLAFLLFSPAWLADFSMSAATAALSVSNIFFWFESGYFDTQAIAKPLLHTWSLGVEEQYYLIWPAILVAALLILGRLGAIALVVALSAGSLAFGEWWLNSDPSGAFYLLPSRVVEFGLGALIVWVARYAPLHGRLAEAAAAGGVGLILGASLLFNEDTRFPGLMALIPCVGAALFIWGGRSRLVGGVFRTAPMVGLGKISYSVYLVHWPLIVFHYALFFARPTPAVAGGVALLCLALGWLQYRFVECRYRRVSGATASNGRFLAGTAASVLLLVSVSSLAYLHDGLPTRVTDQAWAALDDKGLRALQWHRYCERLDPALDQELVTCQNDRGAEHSIFIWGDSHALHLVAGLSEHFPEHNVHVLYQSACLAQNGFGGYEAPLASLEKTRACLARNQRALTFFRSLPPTTVILSGAQRATPQVMAEATMALLDELRAAGHRVIVLGDFIRPGIALLDCVNVPSLVVSEGLRKQRCQGDPVAIEKALRYDARFAELVPEAISPASVQCTDGECAFFRDAVPLFRDHHHLSIMGADYFFGLLKDQLKLGEEPGPGPGGP